MIRGSYVWIGLTAIVSWALLTSPAQAEVSILNLTEGQEGWKPLANATRVTDVKALQDGITEAAASNSPDGPLAIHFLCNERGIALVQYTWIDLKNKPHADLVALACGVGVTVLRRNSVVSVGSTIGIPGESRPIVWNSESTKAIEVEKVNFGAYSAVARREGTAVVLRAIGPDVFALDVVRVGKSQVSAGNGRDPEGGGRGAESGGSGGSGGGGGGGDEGGD